MTVTPGAYRGGMSFTVNLYGHFADPAKNADALAAVRDCVATLDQLADRDAGDSFSGSFSGPDLSVSFPEPGITPDAAPVAEASAEGSADGAEASG